MKLCGKNHFYQLGEKPNNKNRANDLCINPPRNSHLNITTLLSFSLGEIHSVWITKDFRAFGVGSNFGNKISATIEMETLRSEVPIKLNDIHGRQCKFISAVCGQGYSLYLFSSDSCRNNQLMFCHDSCYDNNPYYIDTKGGNPIHLFGGVCTTAAVDENGVIFTMNDYTYYDTKWCHLPDGEKATSVACCSKFYIAVTSNGRVFEANIKSLIIGGPYFEPVKELNGIEVVEASGICEHCLLVCRDGRVFGRGTNWFGQLGLGDAKNIEVFTEITSLRRYKIISASAGRNHSLFITNDGKVLACGHRFNGELFNGIFDKNEARYPIETKITGGATFCIASSSDSSVVFVGCQPPQNTPNMTIRYPTSHPIKKASTESASIELKKEINRLRIENENLRKENIAKEAENKKLRQKHLIDKTEIKKFGGKGVAKEVKKKQSQTDSNINLLSPKILNAAFIGELVHQEEIGYGGCGRVFKVKHHSSLFALKELKPDRDFSCVRGLLVEYELLSKLNHPNIIRTFGFFFGNTKTLPCILLELCNCSLDAAVRNGSINSVTAVFILFQVAIGMRYVHSQGIIHRDLKPLNILLTSDGTAKICDFGIARLMTLSEQSSMTGPIGTQKFMAPEVANEDPNYNEKVDIYSFGVVVFYVLNHGDISPIRIVDVYRGKSPKIPSGFTAEASRLVLNCMQFDASNRPSFAEIVDFIETQKNKLVKLNPSEKEELKRLIDEHKAKIPQYKG